MEEKSLIRTHPFAPVDSWEALEMVWFVCPDIYHVSKGYGWHIKEVQLNGVLWQFFHWAGSG